jgi:hypothetical protein
VSLRNAIRYMGMKEELDEHEKEVVKQGVGEALK